MTCSANPDEVQKYATCYRRHNYRMGKRNLYRASRDILTIPTGSTYLDVGCGRGETVVLARECGLNASGTEIVPELCGGESILEAQITALPFDRIDYVSCYDVLEHLPPHEVPKALDELFRVAKKALFVTTNDRESVVDGMQLHLTRKPREWWHSQFESREHRAIETCTFATESDWHWRIEF